MAFPDTGCMANGPVKVIPRALDGHPVRQPKRQVRRNR
jgi:hypothetical protein